MKYVIEFIDKNKFESNSINSKWNKMPDKPIKNLTYYLKDRKIVLSNFISYNHIVEWSQSFFSNKNTNKISKIILLGEDLVGITEIVIDFSKNIIYKSKESKSKNFYTSWKKGFGNIGKIETINC